MPEAGWPRVHQHQTTSHSNRRTEVGLFRSRESIEVTYFRRRTNVREGSTPEWRTREEWALPLRQGCDIAPSAVSFHIRSFLMAGGKKSGAGDAVGRRAKRAGVRKLRGRTLFAKFRRLTLFLLFKVSSSECYNDTTKMKTKRAAFCFYIFVGTMENRKTEAVYDAAF